MKPEDIEAESFRIIDDEAGSHPFDPMTWSIVRRMIHTTADFEYIQSIRFHPEAVARGISAIRSGKTIVTDTQMAAAGIRQGLLDEFGGRKTCLIGDPEVAAAARNTGETRARLAVDAAVEMMADGIYVVGNAPTALLRLIELIQNGQARPALVIGLPVGFVNAAESKALLLTVNQPYITNVGRKGGSAVAASVVNALGILAGKG